MQDFKTKYGPWAIIAGASEGLGAAFANALAERQLNLILFSRRKDKLEALSKQLIEKYNVEVVYHPIDLVDFQKTKQFISQLHVNIGLLVYNAAFAPIGYFKEINEEDLEKIVDVNIKTPLLLSKLVSTKMIEQGRGGIVLMSSLAGSQGSPKISTYAASKAFNTVLAEGIWDELKENGIDVLACVAGAIRTPGYENVKNVKDAPGTLDPFQIATDTLNALGNGPTIVPGFTNKMARFFMGRLFSRKMAISIMNNNTKNLS